MTELGLKQNLKQFILLVICNGFVGAMIGMERTIIPRIAEGEFQIEAKTAIISFIIVFGIAKAISNYFSGALANSVERKNLLSLGWLFAIPVPIILIYADHWNWIIACNILLGISQGLTWSSTLVMKIDLAGEKSRGMAVGWNEFAGYTSVGLMAFATAYIAQQYGLRPYPFYAGIVVAILGLLMSIFLIKDTAAHVKNEATLSEKEPEKGSVFLHTTFINKDLSAVTQAGLVNNFNDAMVWGLFPIYLAIKGFSLSELGIILAVYPIVWGLGQLITGKAADKLDKKKMLVLGMLLQAIILVIFANAATYTHFIILSVFFGIGKAIVYPTFLAAVAERSHPIQRAESLGIWRFWRDGGYAIGAFASGILADNFSITTTIMAVGGLTLLSSFIIQIRMKKG